MTKKLFCFGYGYTAGAFAKRLQTTGWRIAGTTTSPDKAAGMVAEDIEAHVWNDNAHFDPRWLADASAILVSTPPDETGCPALRAACGAIAERAGALDWFGYLSTNGVYGDHGGAWVDEESELRANTPPATWRIEAEKAWAGLADECGLNAMIFRLPSIYGPGRSTLDRVREGVARRIVKEGQVFNRMHVEDIAAALAASMTAPPAHRIYNLADDEPSPPQDVIEHACRLLGVEAPPVIPFEDAKLSPMAKRFYANNKRVSNARMKRAFDVTLHYPSYREGLEAILNCESGEA